MFELVERVLVRLWVKAPFPLSGLLGHRFLAKRTVVRETPLAKHDYRLGLLLL